MLLLTFSKEYLKYELQELEDVHLLNKESAINFTGTIIEHKSPDKYDVGILLNSCDQGYGFFSMDSISVYFFEGHLMQLIDQASTTKFSMTHLQVVLSTLFGMI